MRDRWVPNRLAMRGHRGRWRVRGRRPESRASRNAYWRLVTSVEQFVKGLFIDYESRLAVPVGTLRQDVFNQNTLSDDAIDAIVSAGDRHRHGARRVRQIADA